MSSLQLHVEPPATESGYDLHTHSTCSDGTETPTQVLQQAQRAGLLGVALTDHDTTAGWGEARIAAKELNLEFLPGMEITTKNDGKSTHLLAYGFDECDTALTHELDKVRESRVNRAYEMVKRLNVDYVLPWESVYSGNPAQTVGRPHIADAMVAAGYFASRGEAFASALGPQSPYYVHTYAIDTAHAVALVRNAGGATVLAHPAAARNAQVISERSLEKLVSAGLWGIELRHPENVADRIAALQASAERFGLHVTGASDYHGSGKENVIGECQTSPLIWNALRSAVSVPA